jgi:WS/DGAT/MGAT family acyltransferase
MALQPLDPVDAAWYHLDGPASPAIVTALALTARPLQFAKVRRALEHGLLPFDRFRQRVVDVGVAFASPAWEDMPGFDLDRHVHRSALPAPHDEAALRALVSDLAGQPLDHALPLWQAYVVENVGAGGALVFRYHHCIGDGAAMMAVAARLFTGPRRRPATPPAPSPAPSSAQAAAPELLSTARTALSAASSLAGLLVKPPDPPSPFKGPLATSQRVAWSKPVTICDAKAIGAASGAKVNDVLTAAVAGALRSYLQGRGIDVRRATLRAMVPVNLRPPERVGQLGNLFGLVVLALPVAVASPMRRLALTQDRMAALKRSSQALAMQALFDLFGRGPKALEDLASLVLGSKASVVLTNVAGPREPVRLAGTPIERMMFCVPHPGNELGMGISILSYGGEVTLTVVADAARVADPESITRAFDTEFAALLKRAKQKPQRRAASAQPVHTAGGMRVNRP